MRSALRMEDNLSLACFSRAPHPHLIIQASFRVTIGLLEMKAMAANRLRSSNQDGSGQLIGKVAVRTASRSSRLSLVRAELKRFITLG